MHTFLLLVLIACAIWIAIELRKLRRKVRFTMSQLDDKIQALTTAVTSENTVIESAVTLLNGIVQRIADAVAAALAAGATPEQLQALTDLNASVTTETTSLAAAVAAGTPGSTP